MKVWKKGEIVYIPAQTYCSKPRTDAYNVPDDAFFTELPMLGMVLDHSIIGNSRKVFLFGEGDFFIKSDDLYIPEEMKNDSTVTGSLRR